MQASANQDGAVQSCILARNEANELAGCLLSVVPVVGGKCAIVIDTGSTDTTPDIARSLGARVHHIPWRNDFASHRNEAAALADTDWVLVLDADEVLDDPGNLLECIGDGTKYAAVGVDVICRRGDAVTKVACQLRCYDRRRGRWKYPYHNVLEVDGPVIASTAVVEAHHDERTEAQAAERLEQILMWRAREPNEAHHVFCATMAARTLQRWKDVIAWGADYLALAPDDRFGALIRYWRADALIQLREFTAARQEVVEGLTLHPGFPDLHRLDVTLALADWAASVANLEDEYAGITSWSAQYVKNLPDVAASLSLPIGFCDPVEAAP